MSKNNIKSKNGTCKYNQTATATQCNKNNIIALQINN